MKRMRVRKGSPGHSPVLVEALEGRELMMGMTNPFTPPPPPPQTPAVAVTTAPPLLLNTGSIQDLLAGLKSFGVLKYFPKLGQFVSHPATGPFGNGHECGESTTANINSMIQVVTKTGIVNGTPQWAYGTGTAWTGKLDITNNVLILAGGSSSSLVNAIRNQIQGGVSIVDNGDLALTSFRGTGITSSTLLGATGATAVTNGDVTIDALDLNVLATQWQQQSGALWTAGDFSGDGKVDAVDLNILAANWQAANAQQAALAAFHQ